jgi:hypothetical protein
MGQATEVKDSKLYDCNTKKISINPDTNNIEWELIINPSKSVTIPFDYTVQWPNDSELDNINL